MEYHCNCCGYDFPKEEEFNASANVIICPMCGAARWNDDDDYIIQKYGGKKELKTNV